MTSSHLGVWETMESLHSRVLKWMWLHETWMQVSVSNDMERARAVAELSFCSGITIYGSLAQSIFTMDESRISIKAT